MNSVKARHLVVQTNSLFPDCLEPAHLNRFSVVLVSVDGDEALTDHYCGAGVFRKVMDNLRLLGVIALVVRLLRG